jgi:spore coat polysaccharide biosynthesis protein SpsF (cytidylyltransferase family)
VYKEKIGIIIQARMQSTRLSGKVNLPFYHSFTILDIIIEKVRILGLEVILAIPEDEQNDILAKKYKYVKVFRGSENNVIQRFIDAAEYYRLDSIIRICADNPFIDEALINQLLNEFNKSIDYLSFKINNVPSIKTHFGFFAEIVSLSCLKRVRKLTNAPTYLEHVTNYIYNHENYFSIKWVKVKNFTKKNVSIRLTIDSIEDFKLCQEIYNDIYPKTGYKHIIEYIELRPDIQSIMKNQILKNTK